MLTKIDQLISSVVVGYFFLSVNQNINCVHVPYRPENYPESGGTFFCLFLSRRELCMINVSILLTIDG
jgi:hypothetical protein